ncbi:MFS general substrate transporter [Mycena metata]|uniref:MFS general substrate transporter n=1 Tax=Mycena metata TaxID=1033252 RepID=A0AAD7IEM6_9AGAR|nr:MFS general substrate transporter [Mycena metata]
MFAQNSLVPHAVDLELACRIQLPPSTSTVFVASDTTSNAGRLESNGNSLPPTDLNGVSGSTNESTLQPTDVGRGAWSFLAAAFVVQAIAWGVPNAYGVFLDSYLQDPRYISQGSATSLLPLIGTLSSGIIYCSGSVVNPIAARYPQHRHKSMWFGAALCFGSLLGSSYATKILHLVLLQGVLYGVGGSLLFLSCISNMSEWFVARRGLANGILFAGTATGGVLLPLVLPKLISKYGSSKTLRILAITIILILSPVLPFVKGRLPHTRARAHGPTPRGAPKPHEWMKHKPFCIFLIVNTLHGLAFFVPVVYLPTFANDVHISSSNSAVTLAMLNAAAVVGRLLMGYLSDKFNPWILALTTLLTTSAATFVLWGVLSHSFAGLLTFSIAYGSVASGWTSVYIGFVKPVAKDDPVLTTKLFGYLLLSRGIGNILSTPLAAKLYAGPHNATDSRLSTGFEVGNGRFKNMIIYLGTCFAGAAGIAALGWAMDARKISTTPRDRSSAREVNLENVDERNL